MSISWLLSVIKEFGPIVSISIFIAGLIWEYLRDTRYVSNGSHGVMKVKDGLPIGIFASIMFIVCVLLATGFLELRIPTELEIT